MFFLSFRGFRQRDLVGLRKQRALLHYWRWSRSVCHHHSSERRYFWWRFWRWSVWHFCRRGRAYQTASHKRIPHTRGECYYGTGSGCSRVSIGGRVCIFWGCCSVFGWSWDRSPWRCGPCGWCWWEPQCVASRQNHSLYYLGLQKRVILIWALGSYNPSGAKDSFYNLLIQMNFDKLKNLFTRSVNTPDEDTLFERAASIINSSRKTIIDNPTA